jgi:glutamyl-tRNA synthetase
MEPHLSPSSPHASARIKALMPHLKDRASTHLDIVSKVDYLLHDGPPRIAEDTADILDATAKERLLVFADAAEDASWTAEGFGDFFKQWMAANDLKMKDVGLPLRAAVTGTRQSPSILDVLVAIGRDETLHRIRSTCKN